MSNSERASENLGGVAIGELINLSICLAPNGATGYYSREVAVTEGRADITRQQSVVLGAHSTFSIVAVIAAGCAQNQMRHLAA